MALFKHSVLKHAIEIRTSPEKIWEFFTSLERNYRSWHPEDHVLFKWTEGEPLKESSTFYAEQYVMGKVKKYKGICSEVVPNRKIVFKFYFPISLVSPKVEWQIEPKGSYSVFTAVTYMRFWRLFRVLFKKGMEKLRKVHDKHVGAEGGNLKKLLEKENN